MAQTHARSGQVVSVLPLGDRLRSSRTTAILKAGQLEVARLGAPGGQAIARAQSAGVITLQFIEGSIEFRTPGARHVLEAGGFSHLGRNEPQAVAATVDSSALLTLCIATLPDAGPLAACAPCS
jgi:quercetin dioxygenase-like cupin family protein